ncbi:MAG: T9SS type A sorting domain-containing protein, partial [Bacteroidota bacterium]
GNINVPTGYTVIYVLTSGTNLVIEQVNSTPDFMVNTPGRYTIHTLVYDADPNSANFLDLNVVQPGVTTGGDVLGIVTANGLCASLDVAGAPVHVNASCTADAGTLTPDQLLVFVSRNDTVNISATPNGDINVPSGYSSIFVLTRGLGLTIEQVNSQPNFDITRPGLYRIHTLVYDADPNSADFLDLSVVQFGVTSGADVQHLIDNSGICADLDVRGAISFVLRTFNFQHFAARNFNNRVQINWSVDNAVPGASYIIERSQDGVVFQQIGNMEESLEGKVSHEMMDENPIEGLNTYRIRVVDSRGQSIDGGDQILFVEFSSRIDVAAYPNPVVSKLTVRRNDFEAGALNMQLVDLTGKQVRTFDEALEAGQAAEIDMSNLPEGFYQLMLSNDRGEIIEVKKISKR